MTNTRLETGADRIATLWLDAPGKRVNTLSTQMWSELSTAIDQVAKENPIALIVASNKTNSFVVGADIFEMHDMSDNALDDYIHTGQRILARLERLPMRTIAAINGDCLGGGLELAMACKVRVCADDPKIKIGLPETKLGLVPGWGGTLRMPRIIGLEESIMLAAMGELIDPQRAAHLGLVDRVVSADQLLATARSDIAPRSRTHSDMVPKRIFAWANEKIRSSRSGETATAPLRVIQAMHDGMMDGEERGLESERRGLVELRRSPESQKMFQQFVDRHAARA